MTHAQAGRRFPDFIIGGAMKAGTSTLRGLLAAHPGILIPDREVHFFCLDDITQHPDYPGPVGGRWVRLDYERDFDTNVAWYAAIFERARPDQLVGEHSTVYLASPRAVGRMARLLPAVKLVFLLRDPVMRAYSHYWHLVRAGRAVHGFEKSLRYGPASLLTRGFYQAQIEGYLQRFPRENVKILVFEEFVRDVQRGVDDVVRFLGLPSRIGVGGMDTHRHRGQVPRFPRLQLMQNRMFRGVLGECNRPDLPNVPRLAPTAGQRLAVAVDRGLRRLHPPSRGDRGPRPETRAFLESVFARENAGLSELLGIDLARYWPYMPRTG
jgi:hypothetical protein